MPGRIFKLVGAIVVLAAVAVVLLNRPAPAPPPSLPNPNGYETLLRAARLLIGDPPDPRSAPVEALREFVATNRIALDLVRTGLAQTCRVPLVFDVNHLQAVHFPEISALKQLGRGLAAEGKLAELETRTNDAARVFVETIQFGHEIARGGVIIDALVGVSIEAVGSAHLHRISGSLDAATCRETARTLESIEQNAPTADEILAQERVWARRTGGTTGALARLVMFRSIQKGENNLMLKWQKQRHVLRVLTLRLAVRAYELEHGQPPASPTGLVPAYLKSVPVDPLTDKPLPLAGESSR